VVSTTVLLLPEFPQISLRMTRWSCRSTTFSDSFVHHVRGPYWRLPHCSTSIAKKLRPLLNGRWEIRAHTYGGTRTSFCFR
jgi:hypothetical protein